LKIDKKRYFDEKMSCGICLEFMTTESYNANTSEDDKIDEKDTNCIRLKCGHAFHVSCTIESFRSSNSCPMCFESDEESEDMTEEISEMENLRKQLQTTNKTVQRARQKLNVSLRQYNVYADFLRSERKKFIRNSLKLFASSRKPYYDLCKKNVRDNLNVVKKAETNELIKTGQNREDVSIHMSVQFFEFDFESNVLCNDLTALDPLERSFWKS